MHKKFIYITKYMLKGVVWKIAVKEIRTNGDVLVTTRNGKRLIFNAKHWCKTLQSADRRFNRALTSKLHSVIEEQERLHGLELDVIDK